VKAPCPYALHSQGTASPAGPSLLALLPHLPHAIVRRAVLLKEPQSLPSQPALPAALLRGALFFGLWLVLTGAEPFGLPFGLIAAFCATYTSLRLLPPGASRIAPGGLPRLALIMLRQSFSAGWDVALRAFAFPPRLAPGVIEVPFAIPPGPARDGFRALASLAPGSLPLEDLPDGRLRLHALDLAMPLAKELAETEAAFARCQEGAQHD
jgi:multicomponent Na+:H+ antiporter subunit E